MSRTKMVNGVPTPMTAQEEAIRDAEEAAWLAGQAARDAEQQRVTDFDAAIKTDAELQTLKTITVAQFNTWWDNNINNLAQLNAVCKRIFRLIIFKLLR